MARATQALMTILMADATVAQTKELQGVGIGGSCYRGRACVATDAGEALEQLQPGDVLVARFTGPSFNSILPLLGALVTEEGGPLCHAAIVAREFGLPAVVGVLGAMTTITHGSTVEVDPRAGRVRVA
jgi:pyruvate,water dikinase